MLQGALYEGISLVSYVALVTRILIYAICYLKIGVIARSPQYSIGENVGKNHARAVNTSDAIITGFPDMQGFST